MTSISSNDLKTNKLPVGDDRPYETVIRLNIPLEWLGRSIDVVADAHGEPKQNNQKELAWSTRLSIYDGTDRIRTFWRARGRDLYKNQKDWQQPVVLDLILPNGLIKPSIKYEMRALNKTSGGNFKLTFAKVTARLNPLEI